MRLSTSRMKGFKSRALVKMTDRTWKFNIECLTFEWLTSDFAPRKSKISENRKTMFAIIVGK